MKTLLVLILVIAAIGNSPAQTILLKNGQSVPATDMVRKDDMLMTAVTTSNGGKGQIGFRVADVAQLNLLAPAEIASAGGLIAKGQFDQAFAEIDPVVAYQKTIRDIAGNWWAKCAVVEVTALTGLNRQADAIALVSEIAANTKDPEIITAAKLQIALVTKYQNPQQALAAYDAVIGQSTDARTLTQAWLAEGDVHAAQHEFADALLAYLTVVVFYPDHNPLTPKALWGSGQAYAKLKDLANATKTYHQLVSDFPDSPEASLAKAALAKTENKI